MSTAREALEMYKYAHVENALHAYIGIPQQSRPALRARLKYLQRMGVASQAPGKGSWIDYDLPEVCKWALCLELGCFGMDPARISSTVEIWWPTMVDEIMGVKEGKHLFLIAIPNAILAGTDGNPNPEDRLLLMPVIPLSGQILYDEYDIDLRYLSRLIIINVSLLRRRVEEALLNVSVNER